MTFPDNNLRRLLMTCEADISRTFADRAAQLEPQCESPIELMLLLALDFSFHMDAWRTGRGSALSIGKKYVPPAIFRVVPQYVWREFRIDFAFFAGEVGKPLVFVECDGHDFHERTATQAGKDKKRDRIIQQAGIPILRFTGREIYRDPFDCAEQIFPFLVAE